MTLLDCAELDGAAHVIRSPPQIMMFHDVIYFPKTPRMPPFPNDKAWGIYDSSGLLIPWASYRRGPNLDLVGQSYKIDLPSLRNLDEAPDEIYYYGGPMHWEYGHFILSSLARLWPLAAGRADTAKILYHSHEAPSGWLRAPYVSSIFGTLNLTEADLACFFQPTRIRNLLIPEALIEEQHHVNAAIKNLAYHIATKLPRQTVETTAKQPPTYLSKAKLSRGVRRFVNEEELTDILENKGGVRIAYPEAIDFVSQVEMFCTAAAILGTIGSAFHTSLFCPSPVKGLAISEHGAINTNFLLIDYVKANTIRYVYPPAGVTSLGPSGRFSIEFRLIDVVNVADNILRLLDEILK